MFESKIIQLQKLVVSGYTAPCTVTIISANNPDRNSLTSSLGRTKITMRVIRILVLIFSLIMVLSLYGCSDDTNEEMPRDRSEETSETWAFYWYLCGSDLESDAEFASIDFEEMLQVTLSKNINIIIETGGAKEWHSDVGIRGDANSRYQYNSEGLSLIEELPVANMGESATLEAFLSFCNKNYPADHQAVIFWNHGGGSISGVAFDELFDNDSLTLPEMRAAFESVGTSSGKKYDLIGFDACLMATIDVVDTFSDFANYLVASEELEPGGGWDYEAIFQSISYNPSMDVVELGKEICDSYYAACENDGTNDMITLSVVDLSQAEGLVQAYNDIGIEALAGAGINPSYFGEFGRTARSAENYGGNNNSEGYSNMVDLGDLVRKAGDGLLPTTGDALLSALDRAVIYKVNGPLRKDASGLSCYYSYNGDYDDYTGFVALNTSPAFQHYFDYMLSGDVSDELVEYMSNVASPWVKEEIVPQAITMLKADDLEDFPVRITEEGFAVLSLGSDISEKLSGVYMNLAYIDEETGFALLLGSDNNLEADWENGVFQDSFQGVWGSLDGELVYMELSEEADDYQIYAIAVLLNGEEYTMLVSYIYATEEYKILGLRSSIDANGMADGNIRPLISGDIVETLHYIIDLETDEISQVAIAQIVVSADTNFYDMDMGDGKFLFLFEMRDFQNNSYRSEAVLIIVEEGEIYIPQ